jgi:hypothetical protein
VENGGFPGIQVFCSFRVDVRVRSGTAVDRAANLHLAIERGKREQLVRPTGRKVNMCSATENKAGDTVVARVEEPANPASDDAHVALASSNLTETV